MPLMGYREYARHREANGLVGGTLTAVQYAIKSGRIREALVEVTGERPRIDSARADTLWSERSATRIDEKGGRADEVTETKTRRTPADTGTVAAGVKDLADSQDEGGDLESASYAAARAAKERANARKAKLEADAMEGRLVDHEAVTGAWEKIISTSRTKVLALPSKIRTRLPKLTAADVSLIEGIVRDTLDELAQGAI